MDSIVTGWEPHRRTHFDEIVFKYDRVRPEYPEEMYDDIIGYADPALGKNTLEIGAGTGKATKPFLDAGYNVTAVEIGANMAKFIIAKYFMYNNFNVVVSSFEDAALKEDSYDLIYSASSFHWVDAEIGCPKVFSLLKNGGTAALIRYNIMLAHNGDQNEEIKSAYRKYYYTYYLSKQMHEGWRSKEEFRQPEEIQRGFGFRDLGEHGFRDVTMRFYDASWSFSADEYIVFLETLSDHRCLPDLNREALYAAVKKAILNSGKLQTINGVYVLYMGKKFIDIEEE